MVSPWQARTGSPFGITGFGLDDTSGAGGAFGQSLTTPFGAETAWGNSFQTPEQRWDQRASQLLQEQTNAWWKPPAGATNTGTAGTNSSVTSFGGEWAGVDKWNNEVAAAARQFGVPANALKALIKLESNGENLAANGATAVGPMQVTQRDWGDAAANMGYDLNDPADNIMMGAFVLKDAYDSAQGWAKANNVDPWKAAFYVYYGGPGILNDLSRHDDPNQGGSGISGSAYGDMVFSAYQQLNGAGGSAVQPGLGGSVSSQNNAPMSTIWGGMPGAQVSQEIGMTDFARNVHPEWYAYSAGFSPDGQPIGHTGIDVAIPAGSALYTPASGTVRTAGGSDFYTYAPAGKGVPGTGELRIELDNGDIVILGHMQSINLQVGDRIEAGQYVGRSGGFNGDHVHVEYRKKTPGATKEGYTIVDPRNYFGGGSALTTGGTSSAASSIPGLPPSAKSFGNNPGGRPFWMGLG